MPRLIFCFLIGFVFVMPRAHAAQFSGQYLIEMCASDAAGKETVAGGHIACQAYIAGIMDYHALIKSMGTAPSVDFCVPDKMPMNRIQHSVQSYILKNQKQHSSFIAAPGVALGLYNAFPCQ